MHKFKKLSLGWSEGTSPLSRLIMRLDGGEYSHVYLLFETECGTKLIYESHLSGGVQITPYEQLIEAMISGKIHRVSEKELSSDPVEIQAVWDEAVKLHGSGYDKLQILQYYVWIRLAGRRGKRIANAFRNDKFTCNEFAVSACKPALKSFADLDFTYTPWKLDMHFGGKE